MRYHPDLAWESLHLHGKPHGRIDSLDVLPFETPDDSTCYVVDVVSRVMELEIRYGTGWASNGLTVHPTNNTDECSRTGKNAEDVLSLTRELFAVHFNEAHVIGAGVEA
jgi:hypothetical protein